MDIIENVKHGLVFWVFGLIFIALLFSKGIITTGDTIWLYGILPVPFFLMGFFDKMLD